MGDLLGGQANVIFVEDDHPAVMKLVIGDECAVCGEAGVVPIVDVTDYTRVLKRAWKLAHRADEASGDY